ncbi:hypothetical protein EYF80_022719 [Liparis tanakae]|uniref:Uncharacterized protein n=1 Tax=Liparis tanakae TaxID=230148 RepID=A0A4Z2HQ01_9TELE|nr:hypothetical protein EYF80_022719 [Liparis tanakae]
MQGCDGTTLSRNKAEIRELLPAPDSRRRKEGGGTEEDHGRHRGLSRAYLPVESSVGTEEGQEPLDRSPSSSCSPGPTVAKAPFDVIHRTFPSLWCEVHELAHLRRLSWEMAVTVAGWHFGNPTWLCTRVALGYRAQRTVQR